jgi:hypothetical protein
MLLEGHTMLPDGHRQAAEDIEAVAKALQANPRAGRVVIESCWGAAFHWIAYGCQRKHAGHQDSHARMISYLRGLGEPGVAGWWERLDNIRQGGWYGNQPYPGDVQKALDLLEEIHTWAQT